MASHDITQPHPLTILVMVYAGSKVSGAGESTPSSPSSLKSASTRLTLYDSSSCFTTKPSELFVRVNWRAFSVLSCTRSSGGIAQVSHLWCCCCCWRSQWRRCCSGQGEMRSLTFGAPRCCLWPRACGPAGGRER